MNLVGQVDEYGQGEQETVNIIPLYHMGCRQEGKVVHGNEVPRKCHQEIVAICLDEIMSCYSSGINVVLTEWSYECLWREKSVPYDSDTYIASNVCRNKDRQHCTH